MRKLYWDIEATNLLNSDSVDYTASPYQLKEDFEVHCVVFIDIDTLEEFEFVQDDIPECKDFLLKECQELIAHNSISYDHMVMMAAYAMDFEIGVFQGEKGTHYSLKTDSLCGIPITITDTLVMSKTLNPDRPMHSIDYFGRLLGLEKIDWRAKAVELGLIAHNAPKGAEFKQYHPEMLVYCKRDCHVGIKVYKFLMAEWGKWDWADAYDLEKATAEIITHQEHRGFKFNSDKAKECVRDLDNKMEELRATVEPLIPEKPIGKTAAKEFIPCAIQFKKNGEISANIQRWVEKHNGIIDKTEEGYIATIFGKQYKLPIPQTPIVTHVKTNIKDTTFIKGWLVEKFNWQPSQYKERDLTVDSKKKKLTQEKFEEAVERYVEQTLNSPFCKDRCEHLEVKPKDLRYKLMKHDLKRPLKVYTNPTLTVGMEKEIDPKLLEIGDKFAHAKDISHYLTYSHRRNSILGGNVDPDDVDEEMEKGWLSVERLEQDGRIPTPADTCGCATSRMKHRLVANVSRTTSLYGQQLRELFGSDVENGFFQLGYDFASLEAMIESHYCWRYDDAEKSYCNSLVQEKPNDVHTKTAAKISAVIGAPFARTPAKSVKYACAYGARPARVAKTVGCSLVMGEQIHKAYWESALPLAELQTRLKTYWETVGGKKFILGLDGRKIPTRSASAIINSLFQSAGVICAKRSMVIHNRKLKEAGLTVNFWKEDWKKKNFVQQMIAYHDEAQMEVHKSLVTWKLFDTEEEAKAFKQEHEGWSEIGHSSRGYYVADCIVGRLIQESVKEASAYYKLNVTLAADYIMGRNWAECH